MLSRHLKPLALFRRAVLRFARHQFLCLQLRLAFGFLGGMFLRLKQLAFLL